MSKHDDAAMEVRREAVWRAGAAAAELPVAPEFEGHVLGSMERCIFYDGYASTHPGFKNPYRLRVGQPCVDTSIKV